MKLLLGENSMSVAAGCHQSLPPRTEALQSSFLDEWHWRFGLVNPGELIEIHLQCSSATPLGDCPGFKG